MTTDPRLVVTLTASNETRRPIAEARVATWNAFHPVGTLVDYWRGQREGEPSGRGRTYHEATVLGGHTAVVWIEGCSGAIALTHVEIVDEALAWEALRTAAVQAGEATAAEARIREQLDKEANH